MKTLPCLSVRQPWAWLIVNGWKNVENRTWPTKVRGRIAIHTSSRMTLDDYHACRIFMRGHGMDVELPHPHELKLGGIVGITTLLDCVQSHPSEWFTGPWGFVLDDSAPSEFIPSKGRLGFFHVTDAMVRAGK